nr:unnamed protein product [Digitaria exilis]
MAGAAILRPRKRPRRRNHAASIPLDLVLEIAARSDPATLLRCAAACRELRRHISDPIFFHGRLRLRRHADQFVPSLLRGGLVDRRDRNLILVDKTGAATRQSLPPPSSLQPKTIEAPSGMSTLRRRATASSSSMAISISFATYYVLKAHLRAARVTFTELPKSFHVACRSLRDAREQILLVTSPPLGRSPMVLVANNGMISAWAQSERTGKWSKQPHFIVKDCGAAMKAGDDLIGSMRLDWFAERSGIVLVAAPDTSMSFLLDLQSKGMTECCSSSSSTIAYEMDVASWVPTFTQIL